jgi:hypothetical protein
LKFLDFISSIRLPNSGNRSTFYAVIQQQK